MTEEEAKTKWCPFARNMGRTVAWNRNDSGSSHESGKPLARCVASNCMAWRWALVANPAWTPRTSLSSVQTNPYSDVPSGIPSTTYGYCGLAGAN